jgi:hypothetical protein
MSRFIDIAGKRFGRLIAIKAVTAKGTKNLIWKCICDCGGKSESRSADLRQGRTKSCGCMRGRHSNQKRLRPYEALYNRLHKLNRKRFAIGLTYEEFLEFTKVSKCSYCKGEVTWTRFNTAEFGSKYNLDRVDSAKEYVKDNLVVCCWKCNRAKSDTFTGRQWRSIVGFMK